MIRYGQVKGRKYPANQPVLSDGQPTQQRQPDEKPGFDYSVPVIVDGCRICTSVHEAAAFADAKPYEVARVLKGERNSVKGHTFRAFRYAYGGAR